MALCYAQFINPIGGPEAIRAYRNTSKPRQPRGTKSSRRHLPPSARKTRKKRGDPGADRLPPPRLRKRPNTTRSHRRSSYRLRLHAGGTAAVLHNRRRTAIGTPEQLHEKFTTLAAEFDVDEFVISTFTEKPADRLHSMNYSHNYLN